MVTSTRKTVILVVEDDTALRTLYRTGLMQAGYTVVAVDDGLDALRHIEAGGVPNAVVLDLDLPRVSGRDVHRELLTHPHTMNVPVVMSRAAIPAISTPRTSRAS